MKRICPECKSILGNYDHYFCSNCGSPLPSDLVLKKAIIERKTFLNHENIGKKDFLSFTISINQKVLLSFFSMVIFLVIVYFLSTHDIFSTFNLNREKIETVNEGIVSNQNIVEENVNKEQNIPESPFPDYIPYQSSIYIKIRDEDHKDNFFDYIDEEFETYYIQNKDYISEDIAFFGLKAGDEIFWNMILKMSEGYSAPENLESFEKDGYLVVSEYEEIINEVENAYNQISKNLSKSSKYVLAKSNIPKESNNYMVILDTDFKKDITDIMENEIIPQFYRDMLIDIKETQLDYAFIL